MPKQTSVSKKMVEALESTVDVAFCEHGGPAVLKAEEATQAVINAAWVEFDKDDKSTWPPIDDHGNSTCYLVMVPINNHRAGIVIDAWRKPTKNNRWHFWDRHQAITHWADPKHLMKVKSNE